MTIICKIFKATIFLVALILKFITRLLKKLNDISKFCYLVEPLFKKFSNLITGQMIFLLRIKRCSSNSGVKLVFSLLAALSTIESFTRNCMVNRLEYGVQTSSCHASSFFISKNKNTALKNPVEKYFFNRTIVSKPFLIKLKAKHQLYIRLVKIAKKMQRSLFYVFSSGFLWRFHVENLML